MGIKWINILSVSCRKCAQDALEDVCKWLDGGGEVAVSEISGHFFQPSYPVSCNVLGVHPSQKETYFFRIHRFFLMTLGQGQ